MMRLIAVCILAVSAMLGSALAQSATATYPSRVVRLIVPYPPGGPTDVLARLVANALQEDWQQSVIVENIAGASGLIGTRRAARSKPDGYTLLLASSTGNAALPFLMKDLGFDPVADFTPIALVTRMPAVLVARDELGSLETLLARARAKPNSVRYGTAGVGTASHLAAALFESEAGFKGTHIPYKGSVAALTATMTGEVDFTFDTGISGFISRKQLTPIAIASVARSKELPRIPTFVEIGLTNVTLDTWFGIAGPAGMPADLVGRVNKAVIKAITAPGTAKRIEKHGSAPAVMSPAEFASFWQSEVSRYKKIVALSGATAALHSTVELPTTPAFTAQKMS